MYTEEDFQIGWIMRTGVCLSVLPFTVNGSELWVQEFRDSLLLRYVIDPPKLTRHCDGCGAEFDIFHDLDFNKGGLIKAHRKRL